MNVLNRDLNVVDDLRDQTLEDALTLRILPSCVQILARRAEDLGILQTLLFRSLGACFVFFKVDFGLGGGDGQ